MQLNKLQILKGKEILREIEFKKGLNLILNSASSQNKTGNSVGKSTLSRLIDYIFLSDGQDIYKDSEFKKDIPEVVSFIENNTIVIHLLFKSYDKNEYTLSRDLTTNQKKCRFYIDGKEVDKKIYSASVSKLIFGINSEKPSVRNIAHKFIRNTNDKMQNTIKFLHVNTTPDVYDQLYLYLFGFDGLNLLKEKADFNNKIKLKNKHLAAYRNPHRESALQKMLKPLKDEEAILQRKIDTFDFTDSQESDVKKLVEIQSKISDLTIAYTTIQSKINFIQKSIDNLKNKASSINGRELSEIYNDAGVSISTQLKRSFEELTLFHNKLIKNKTDLLLLEIEKNQNKLEKYKVSIDELHISESNIFKYIREPNTLKSISQIYNDLTSIKEQVANVNSSLLKIEETKNEINELERLKGLIVNNIAIKAESLNSNIELFNDSFGEFSKKFYDERYVFDLEFDVENEKCRYEIANLSPNPTGGKKKGELSAFDLAYIDFVNKTNLKRPNFVIHDSIEDVDVNQVFDIFELANNSEGQYIVALLSDKISNKIFQKFIDNNVILELSEKNKFFKI
jgi:hypothetical protein